MKAELAIIGGTGVYNMPGLENLARHAIDTPFGTPSDDLVSGTLGGHRVMFLARHGEGHAIPPHHINYRANIHALHTSGVRRVVAINAVGGIRADLGPRTVAVPDQLIDYTWGRVTTFSDAPGAAVEHIDFSEPYSTSLRRQLIAAAAQCGVAVVQPACMAITQGPRLETRAEVARLRRDGCDLVGMTGMPEAALARELGLDYACLALVSNWAAGCGDADQISLEEILANVAALHTLMPGLLSALAGSNVTESLA